MPQSSTHDDIRTRTYAILLLCLLVGVVFYPVLSAEFLHWDDDVNISRNPNLQGPARQVIQWSLTDTSYQIRYQPLCWLTWASIGKCFGMNPFYFHLALLTLQAVNSAFLLIRRLLLLAAQKAESDSPAFSISAALAAAVWAVHPLRVETTAWAVELVFSLPLFFFLLSLLSYLRSASRMEPRARLYRWGSVLLFGLSLAAYPLVLGGFVVFVALDIFPLRRLSLNPTKWFSAAEKSAWLEKIPFAVMALLFGWFNLHVRSTANVVVKIKPPTLAEFGVVPRIMQAFFIWAHNVWKPFVPVHLTPVPQQLVDFNPFAPMFVFGAVLVIALTGLLYLNRRRWPGTFAVWVSYLALLVPVLGLSEHPHYSSDRYSLIVDIGWSVLLGGLLVRLMGRPEMRRVPVAAVVVLIGGLSYLSRQQTELWQTNIGFFRTLIAQTENEPKMGHDRLGFYERLAESYSERGNLAEGAETLRAAIRIWPGVPDLYHALGNTLEEAGDMAEAMTNLQAAMQLNPTSLPVLNDLGLAYAKGGKYEQAEAMFSEILRRDPSEKSVLENMARTLTLHGKTNETEIYLQKLKVLQDQKPASK